MGKKKHDSAAGNIIADNITVLPDGSTCIGRECARIIIPPKDKGNIKVDITGCTDEERKLIINKLAEGGQGEWKVVKDVKTDEKHNS